MKNTIHILDTAIQHNTPGGNSMRIRRALVIHFTNGNSARSSIAHMEANGKSCHLVIDRDGTIYQMRPFNLTCEHAGVSRWVDPKTDIRYESCNRFTIGIELANAGDDAHLADRMKRPTILARHRNGGPVSKWERFPAEQLAALYGAARILVLRYNLDDVTGHDCVAPERKNDPGPAFPMESLRRHCGFDGLPAVHRA